MDSAEVRLVTMLPKDSQDHWLGMMNSRKCKGECNQTSGVRLAWPHICRFEALLLHKLLSKSFPHFNWQQKA